MSTLVSRITFAHLEALDFWSRVAGTTRWQIRFYDYSGPKRRHLSRSFSTEAAATAFSVALKAERAA